MFSPNWLSRLGVMALPLLAIPAWGQGEVAALSMPQLPHNKLETDGIVTDQTITLPAKQFYDVFMADWRDLDENGRFTLSISERPSARWGSQVFVDYGNHRLFQALLPPNADRIRNIARGAVQQVYQAIVSSQVADALPDPDLARDEF
jgi:curli production assembly/transport component CsgE